LVGQGWLIASLRRIVKEDFFVEPKMPKPPERRWKSRTKQDLIIEVWEELDCESVGTRELEQIQQVLREEFGEGGRESPAAIARTVADEGAVLRHPEVFDCDLKWRRQDLEDRSFPDRLDFSNLSSAFESVVRLEERRLALQTDSDPQALEKLRGVVVASRNDLLLRARSKILQARENEVAIEVLHWLTVWLQSPELFSDWLDLRRRSPEFRKKFED
jgi:hypothetical protein